jgi:hypothetical protein
MELSNFAGAGRAMNIALWFGLASVFRLSPAQAAVTANIEQSGPDVVATATGALNTTGLAGGASGPSVALLEYVNATNYAYLVGSSGGRVATYYLPAFVTTQPLHSAAFNRDASRFSGAAVGVDGNGGANPILVVPIGYVSGAAIDGTATWTNTTLAGLSLTPGAFVFAYGADRITFNVIDRASPPRPAEAIPSMSAWMLGLLSFSLLILAVRRPRHTRD